MYRTPFRESLSLALANSLTVTQVSDLSDVPGASLAELDTTKAYDIIVYDVNANKLTGIADSIIARIQSELQLKSELNLLRKYRSSQFNTKKALKLQTRIAADNRGKVNGQYNAFDDIVCIVVSSQR